MCVSVGGCPQRPEVLKLCRSTVNKVASHLTQVLGNEPGSSGRAEFIPNLRGISLALTCPCFYDHVCVPFLSRSPKAGLSLQIVLAPWCPLYMSITALPKW